MSDLLKEELNKRLKKGSFPIYWTPKVKGEELIGEIVSVRQSSWDEKIKVYEIRTLNGEEYNTPNNVILNRLLEKLGPEEGDYILIRYEGMITTTHGKKAKDFSASVLQREEIEEIMQKKPVEKEESKPKIESIKISKETKEFIDELFDFYTDGIPEQQFKKYLEKRGIRVPLNDIISEYGLVVENDVIKRRR